jgi:signal transduction histidine kinase
MSHQVRTGDEMEAENQQEYSSLPVGTKALVTELLATLSHELRSPLATIKAYTATLVRRARSISRAERHEFLLAIERATDHLEVVIDHLLDMAALETGTLVLEKSAVNLVRLVREAISAAERHSADAEQPHRTSRFQFEDRGSAPGDDMFIEADFHLLRKALGQLLENAVTYSPEGGAIDVVLRMVSPADHVARADLPPQVSSGRGGLTMSTLWGLPGEQEWVEISVRDEGLGIAAEHLPRVFDPFYRVDARLSREVNGLGIGLAICKRIVELHGGVIWVESTVGVDSMFFVWLPRGRQHVDST